MHKGIFGVNVTLKRMTHKRNPLVAIMVLPIAIFLWTIGWCLHRIGSQHRSLTAKTADDKDFVSIITAFPEEQEIPER
jgi:hypothetical protein